MASITSFSFVLVFILVLIGDPNAQSQAMETILSVDGSGHEPARKKLPTLGKEAYDAVPAATKVGNSRIERRKMMFRLDLEKKTVPVEGSDQQSVGKSGHTGKGILNVNYKLRNRNLRCHRKAKITADFTAFSADYHAPKSHPPKNN